MSDFQVRTARPEDIAATGEITVNAFEADGFLDGDGNYAAELADAASRARQATLLVAADAENTILGSVTFCRAGNPYAEVALAGEAEFRMLAVAPHARGRGVGHQLVQACIDLARHHGDEAISLSSLATMHTAHRLYERLGFVRAPERDHEPVPGVALVAYCLRLR